jgi:cation diffusion facilitator family transporter
MAGKTAVKAFRSKDLIFKMKSGQRSQVTKKVTLIGALVNALLASLQIVFGLLGHSQALLADGIHTLSDLGSDFIVLMATSQSAKAPDKEHPYGHGRIETLASVLLGLILIAVGIGIGFRGISNIISPDHVMPNAFTLVFAIVSILSKESLYRYTLKASKQIHSTLLETNAWHHRSDALSSIVVLCGISAQILGVPYMDSLAAAIIALMIIFMGYKLARKAFDELIDTSLDPKLVSEIQHTIEQNDDVNALHSLRTRSMGGQGYLDAEIRVNPRLTVSEAHHIAFSLAQQIKTKFSRIIDVGIHVDPFTEVGHDWVSDLPSRREILNQLTKQWARIDFSANLESIQLHYLNSRVEIDLVLPLTLADSSYQQQIDELIAEATKISFVGQVNVYFIR